MRVRSMRFRFGTQYPNGRSKAWLYRNVLKSWMFDCSVAEFDLEARLAESELGSADRRTRRNCTWYRDSGGFVVVAGVLLKDPDLQIIVLGNTFAIVPRQRTNEVAYQSAFISYGGPDQLFAERLFRTLKRGGVNCFFFKNSAVAGHYLHMTMYEGVHKYDRAILVCSWEGLHRPGVQNELQHVFAREAERGGEALIIPVVLDDCLLRPWPNDSIGIRDRLRKRVWVDAMKAQDSRSEFTKMRNKILEALRIARVARRLTSR